MEIHQLEQLYTLTNGRHYDIGGRVQVSSIFWLFARG